MICLALLAEVEDVLDRPRLRKRVDRPQSLLRDLDETAVALGGVGVIRPQA